MDNSSSSTRLSRQTHSVLRWCWTSVVGGTNIIPTLGQFIVFVFTPMRAANANIIHCNYIGRRSQSSSRANSRRYGNIFLLLGQSRRRWSKLRSTLAKPFVLAGVVAWIQGHSARAAYMQLGQNSLVFRATAVVTQCGDIPWRCKLERQAR